MRVFKTTYTDRQGKQREAAKWYIEFRDHAQTVRRLPAFTDKAQSEQAGRNIEKLVAARINHESLEGQLAKWFGGLPTKMQETLAGWGVVEGKAVVGRKTLDKHLDEFEVALTNRGNTAKHAALATRRAKTLFTGCGFKTWNDINADGIERHLAKLRTGDEKLSRQTTNFYLQAAKQFAKWMVAEGRATHSPIDHLKALNVAVDRRHDRRALSVDEIRRLLAATVAGPDRYKMPADERALLYRLAVESGLRSNELRSLTRSSFRFGRKIATVTVEAGSSKRRRRDELPLRPDTAAMLQSHLASKHPGAAAFSMPKADFIAKMIRADLSAARDAWLNEFLNREERAERERSTFLLAVDETGHVVDFHALRHTFLTNLARSGVHPRIMQALARHCDPRLTLGRYTHTELGEQSEAVALLPELIDPSAREQRATGTMGPNAGHSVLASCLAQMDSESLTDMHGSAVVEGSTQATSAHEKTPELHDENRVSQGFSAERAGFVRPLRCKSLCDKRFARKSFASNHLRPPC
jgi:integrase